MIALEDGLDINQANIDSDSCISDRCSVSFSLTKPVKQVYKLRINSSSVFGESTFQFPETIGDIAIHAVCMHVHVHACLFMHACMCVHGYMFHVLACMYLRM